MALATTLVNLGIVFWHLLRTHGHQFFPKTWRSCTNVWTNAITYKYLASMGPICYIKTLAEDFLNSYNIYIALVERVLFYMLRSQWCWSNERMERIREKKVVFYVHVKIYIQQYCTAIKKIYSNAWNRKKKYIYIYNVIIGNCKSISRGIKKPKINLDALDIPNGGQAKWCNIGFDFDNACRNWYEGVNSDDLHAFVLFCIYIISISSLLLAPSVWLYLVTSAFLVVSICSTPPLVMNIVETLNTLPICCSSRLLIPPHIVALPVSCVQYISNVGVLETLIAPFLSSKWNAATLPTRVEIREITT